MGEGRTEVLRVGFDGGRKLEFHGSQVTSDGALRPYRALDDVLGLRTYPRTQMADLRMTISARKFRGFSHV